jgi:hypothetical protein
LKNISNYHSSNIFWEVCLKHPSKGSSNAFGIQWKIFDEDSKYVYGLSIGSELQANTSHSYHPGLVYQKLEPGSYRLDICVKDEIAESNTFEVF